MIILKAIRSMFEMDFNDHKVGLISAAFSKETKKIQFKLVNGILLTNGHYEIPLSFRNSETILPNNRKQQKSSNEASVLVEKKMQRDTKYHRDYSAFMNKRKRGSPSVWQNMVHPPSWGRLFKSRLA